MQAGVPHIRAYTHTDTGTEYAHVRIVGDRQTACRYERRMQRSHTQITLMRRLQHRP
jgi:hypothetical protein